MKKTHVLLIVVLAVAIGAVISTIGDASTYVDFSLAQKNAGESFTVIGYLDKESSRDYDPRTGLLTFRAIDKSGDRRTVRYHGPEPQDFVRSEEITMKGYARDSVFIADEILMKCPSKYNESNEIDASESIYYED